MKEIVIARDLAEKEVAEMVEMFDGNLDRNGPDWENIVSAYQAGRITVDKGAETMTYAFAVPVELKNGETISSVEFHEPNSGELEFINKGMRVKVGDDGSATMDLGDLYVKTGRMLVKICGMQASITDRIKRRDMAVLNSICNFFG